MPSCTTHLLHLVSDLVWLASALKSFSALIATSKGIWLVKTCFSQLVLAQEMKVS